MSKELYIKYHIVSPSYYNVNVAFTYVSSICRYSHVNSYHNLQLSTNTSRKILGGDDDYRNWKLVNCSKLYL